MDCEGEWEDVREAFDDYVDGARAKEEAEQKLEDERGFFEEETAGTGVGIFTIGGAIVGAIATGGWLGIGILVFGTGAGAGAIVYSETDRQDDIDSAKSALAEAIEDLEEAEDEWNRALAEYCRCRAVIPGEVIVIGADTIGG